MALHGHLWTCLPHAWGEVRRPPLGEGVAWRTQTPDGVSIHGRLHLPTNTQPTSTRPTSTRPTSTRPETTQPTTLIVVIHGLGSDHDRPYVRIGAKAALDAGVAVLRLELRGGGADPQGLYHAGLLSDLDAVLACPALQGFDVIHVMGYSLGGHLAMVLGVEATDPRIGRVAAICAPLDLAVTQRHIDHRRRSAYRHNILVGLKASYKTLADRMAVPCPWSVVKRVRTIYEWDARVVVPHYGFGSVENYYATVSAGPRLDGLQRDALFVATVHDPMIPVDSLRPYLDAPRLTARLLDRGGHVYFPKDVQLGFGDRSGVEAQVVHWLLEPAA